MKLPTSGHSASIARARASNAARSSGAYRIAMFPFTVCAPGSREAAHARVGFPAQDVKLSRGRQRPARLVCPSCARAIAERGDRDARKGVATPTYFFDLIKGNELVEDDQGEDFADIETRSEAGAKRPRGNIAGGASVTGDMYANRP